MEQRENSAVLASAFPVVSEVIQDVEVGESESSCGDEVGLRRGHADEAENDPKHSTPDAVKGEVSREDFIPFHEEKLKA